MFFLSFYPFFPVFTLGPRFLLDIVPHGPRPLGHVIQGRQPFVWSNVDPKQWLYSLISINVTQKLFLGHTETLTIQAKWNSPNSNKFQKDCHTIFRKMYGWSGRIKIAGEVQSKFCWGLWSIKM